MPEKANGLAGTTVLVQGQRVEAKQWNVPIPVDAGEIEIHVETPSGKTWTHRVRIESATDKQSVTIPPELFITAKKDTPPPPPTKPASRKQWQSKLGWVSMGTGLLSFGASGLLTREALRLKDLSNADGHCQPNNRWYQTGLAVRNSTLAMSHWGDAPFWLGRGVGRGKKKEAEPQKGKSSGLSLGIDIGPAKVGLNGAW